MQFEQRRSLSPERPYEVSESIIGLFGTCDNVPWRDRFISKYESLGIPYYNPMIDSKDWHPGLLEVEAGHLANDPIILFPILNESFGIVSLTEIGWEILHLLHSQKDRVFLIYVDLDVVDRLKGDVECAKYSVRCRKILKNQLEKLNVPNVRLVSSLDEMLSLSIELYQERLK